MEKPFQDIRITGLDTHKSHDLPSQDGTQRLYLLKCFPKISVAL